MPAAIPIMIGLTAAGTAIQATGQIKAGNAAKRQGEAEQRAAESEAQLSEYNAQVAALQAKDALERGVEEAGKFRAQVRGLIGSQRAGFASGNIDVGVGSAVDVQADTARLGELDALTIKTNAAREAWGYQVQAEDLRTRAQIQRQEGVMDLEAGKAAQGASRYAAAGSIIGGANSIMMTKYGFGAKKTPTITGRTFPVKAVPGPGL